jgi:pyruvate-ferredoxin/flavodoxin oxidoreductase
VDVQEYAYNETRYRMLVQSDEARAEQLMRAARDDVQKRWNLYKQMAAIQYNGHEEEEK